MLLVSCYSCTRRCIQCRQIMAANTERGIKNKTKNVWLWVIWSNIKPHSFVRSFYQVTCVLQDPTRKHPPITLHQLLWPNKLVSNRQEFPFTLFQKHTVYDLKLIRYWILVNMHRICKNHPWNWLLITVSIWDGVIENYPLKLIH